MNKKVSAFVIAMAIEGFLAVGQNFLNSQAADDLFNQHMLELGATWWIENIGSVQGLCKTQNAKDAAGAFFEVYAKW